MYKIKLFHDGIKIRPSTSKQPVSNLNTPGPHVLVDTETKASRRLIDKRQLIYIFEHERLDFYFRPSYLLTDCMNEKSLHRLSGKSPEKYAARVGHCKFVKMPGKTGQKNGETSDRCLTLSAMNAASVKYFMVKEFSHGITP